MRQQSFFFLLNKFLLFYRIYTYIYLYIIILCLTVIYQIKVYEALLPSFQFNLEHYIGNLKSTSFIHMMHGFQGLPFRLTLTAQCRHI